MGFWRGMPQEVGVGRSLAKGGGGLEWAGGLPGTSCFLADAVWYSLVLSPRNKILKFE